MLGKGSIQKTGKNSYKLTVSGGFDANGKRIRYTKTIHATSEREAQQQLALFVADVNQGNVATSGKMTLDEFYDFWKENFALKNLAPTTLAYYDNIFPRIQKALGHKRLDKIEPRHLLAFYKNLAEPGVKKVQQKKDCPQTPLTECLSVNTIRKHHAMLSMLFNKAVKWGLLPFNPAERVEPPKVERKPKVIYSKEQLGQFLQVLETAETKYRLLVMLAFTGGLRREELFGLEWKHIDFANNTINIEQASVYIPGKGTITKDTKTANSNRTISLPASVMKLFRQYKAEQNETRLKLGDKWEEHGRVFTQWNGRPAHPQSFYTWLRRFTARHNLPPITPHTFRHMTATFLITSGIDIRTVAGKLGHAQTSTTINIYSHLLKSAEQETADKMETILQAIEQEKAKSRHK